MGRFRVIFFALILGALPGLNACIWCTDKEIPVLKNFEQEYLRKVGAQSPLLSGKNSQKISDVSKFIDQKFYSSRDTSDSGRSRFYTEYLSKFYPRAHVITEILFPTMCPAMVVHALEDFMYLVREKSWFYFAGHSSDITLQLVHIDILLKQLDLVARGIKKLSCEKNKIYWNKKNVRGNVSLINFWKTNGEQKYFDIFALRFDYLVRMSYLAILFRDYTQAYIYSEKMHEQIKDLYGSQYEQKYTQVVSLYDHLNMLLRKDTWGEL